MGASSSEHITPRFVSMSMQSIKNKAYEAYKDVSVSITGVSHADQFDEKGTITPEQFIAAGDMLTGKCRTWTWERACDVSKSFDYLPPDKQFLITRRVPCLERASAAEYDDAGEEELIEGDDCDSGWAVPASIAGANPEAEEIVDIDEPEATEEDEIPDIDDDDDDFIPDLDDFDDVDNLVVDEPTVPGNSESNDTIVRSRTYDIYITYDSFFQTPKVYLQGYDESDQPLEPAQMEEDIAADYVKKTVSIEQHPHLELRSVYIHPCRHAEVMKRFIDVIKSHGNEITPEMSLFLFLKFLSSVIPTVQYDFTMDIGI